METRASYLIVGSFTLALLLGLVGAVVWLAGAKLDAEFSYYDILFEGSVTGLKPGNPVRYRGVPVGAVTDMRINPDNVEQVRVTIEVPKDTPIRKDTVASLELQGITGVAYVQISGGTNEAPPLRPEPGKGNPIIPSKPSQLKEVIESAPELINQVIALVGRANRLLSVENQNNFARTMANMNTLTGAFAESSGDIRTLLSDGAEALAEFRAASQDARALVQSVRDSVDTLSAEAGALLGDLRDDADRVTGEVAGLGPEARASLRELKAAAESLRRSQDELAGLIEENRDPIANFTSSGLYEFSALLAETRVLVSALTRISGEIERDPARFLFGDTQQGVGVR